MVAGADLSLLSEDERRKHLKEVKQAVRFLNIMNVVVAAATFLTLWFRIGGGLPIPLYHKLGVYENCVWSVALVVLMVILGYPSFSLWKSTSRLVED